MTGIFSSVLLLLVAGSFGRPLYPLPSKYSRGSKQPLQTFRPYNIAHRGSNGEIPEETSLAYMREVCDSKEKPAAADRDVAVTSRRAIEEGTDFIETDILSSKDGVLICFHDVILDDTTDIAEHKQFANRKRTYEVQGSSVTGFFTVDFTLEELKSLRVKQRYPFRDQQYNGKFPIITFEEFIDITLDAPRIVGIYPEIKNPVFINQHSYWEITSDSYFDYIKDYVVGIGPWKDTVVPVVNNYLQAPTDLVARAHAHNLQVHPYTFRNENQFLHLEFHEDPYAEYDFWINQIGVDGLFTDFTGSLHNFQEWTSSKGDDKSASKLLHEIAKLVSSYKKS
ncbi:hypothetical protein TIFTF001_023424 [Ficus carica]|uniref:glycerophosphodiester phosphodiesterase n=1 Tax=Ficus carica TaxID=3494 RepID=A0AA88DDQ1_FICCA|nr:hypothetical protein TIFTF001_023424 [Ficus carica]